MKIISHNQYLIYGLHALVQSVPPLPETKILILDAGERLVFFTQELSLPLTKKAAISELLDNTFFTLSPDPVRTNPMTIQEENMYSQAYPKKKLNATEREILFFLLDGLSVLTVCKIKNIAYKKCQYHKQKALKKMGLPNIHALANILSRCSNLQQMS